MPADRYRLPVDVRPSAYDLTLDVDMARASFSGSVATSIDVSSEQSELVCNAVDLEIEEAWVESLDGKRVDVATRLDAETERAHLGLSSPIDAGRHVLHMKFKGELNAKLVGFYRSTFKDSERGEQTVAVTQFEATHARRAFPCWDEPERKAALRLTLEVPEGLTAISNGPIESEEPAGPGRRRVRFGETMAMSTYIYAWVVGPLEMTDAVRAGGTELRVAHTRQTAGLDGFARESAAFGLEWLRDYYGLEYPGAKCDLVAVPDFAFGAMENLGCITFREVLLMIDPDRATQQELQRVADVIHHELAHMWFGDLVTMRWWNGIWLNEAFATFMEMKCTEAFRPEWDRWTDFGLSRTAALEVDSLVSTRPIEYEVDSPEEAEGMFDLLTYEKGAAVLRMLEQFLGEDEFRAGIRKYLADNAYGNTETTDLWDALESATGQPVRRVADGWVFQAGYPVLSAEVTGTKLRVSQQRFGFGAANGDGTTWGVPVLLRVGHDDRVEEHRMLLDGKEAEVELAAEPSWVQLNAGGSGVYRVRYSPQQLEAMSARREHLSALERYQLLDDAYASLLAGSTPLASLVELLRIFADDPDVSVVERVAGTLRMLGRLAEPEARGSFEGLTRTLAMSGLERMGHSPADGEPERTRMRRAVLFELAGTIGADDSVLVLAREIHARHLEAHGSTDPALTAAAIDVIGDRGVYDDFVMLRDLMRQSKNPQDERRYLDALSQFRDRRAFDEMLAATVDEIRTQDAPFVLARALANHELGPVAWEFVKDRWSTICERFPTSTISRMLEGIKTLLEPAVAADVRDFFEKNPVEHGARTIEQHLERLAVNVAFRQREASNLTKLLATYAEGS